MRTNPIDRLGYLNEAISQLTKEADAIKRALKKAGKAHQEGTEYAADLITQTRSYLDQDAVKAKLSPQFIAAHTRTASVVSVKVRRIEDIKGVAA